MQCHSIPPSAFLETCVLYNDFSSRVSMFFFGNIRAGKVKVVTVVTGSLPKGFALSSRIFQNPPTPELISAFCPRLHLMSHLRLRPTIGRQAIHALQCLWFWLKHGPIMSHIYIYMLSLYNPFSRFTGHYGYPVSPIVWTNHVCAAWCYFAVRVRANIHSFATPFLVGRRK